MPIALQISFLITAFVAIGYDYLKNSAQTAEDKIYVLTGIVFASLVFRELHLTGKLPAAAALFFVVGQIWYLKYRRLRKNTATK